MSGVSGGGGRSGNGSGRIVLGKFRSKVGWEGGRGELFYGTDVAIGRLRRGTRSQVSFEVEERGKMWGVVSLGLACKP